MTEIRTKLTKEEIEKCFPVKSAVRENAIDLIKGLEDAALAVGDDHSNSNEKLIGDLRVARKRLSKFVNILIEEVLG